MKNRRGVFFRNVMGPSGLVGTLWAGGGFYASNVLRKLLALNPNP